MDMMNLNPTRTREYLKQFNFQALFIEELGWNRNTSTLPITVEGQTFTLQALAVQSGLVAYQCNAPDGNIPPYHLRRQIEQRVAKLVREHLVIYTDRAQTTQVWQWVKREQGKPLASREHTFHRNQSGDLLIQKLDALVFTLAEQERGIGIFDAVTRVRAGFDVERVTKKFYDRFKTEHDRFLKMVDGIPDAELERWYASVMLNRLMFIYFVQKKNFLNGDTNYLRNRLSESKKRGKDKFYREVLLPLFFKGFALKPAQRDAATKQLLGSVPYLNGGLFTEHYIEQLHGSAIAIPDSAFEKIFAFFDEYQWHLDDRPLREGNEINPDVLGYIFEKYINQKQMGAYYTKEDITEYISKNTILPYLFDAARVKISEVFKTSEISLTSDPDRYIYDAVKTGVDKPLPPNIAAGIADVSKRAHWNKPAPAEFALPTEIWREVVARRQRYEEVKQKLTNGEIASINDFITYNLNIRQFAQDAIQNTDDPQALRAFWDALQSVSVLDPTCGSGAFLFAALNILEPLYEACLERMQAFVDEFYQNSEFSENSEFSKRFQKYSDFRETLARVAKHPNRAYFIYKSIIVNNLYGVDIMEEAIEICKLRLFLKLVAQVETADKIEPLPDIDFNIRAGNTLVGFATRAQVEQAVKFAEAGQMRMLSSEDTETMKRIDERAELADRAFQQFRLQQTELGGEVTPADKANLRQRLQDLDDELNRYLAKQYGIPAAKNSAKNSEARQNSEVLETSEFSRWLASHKPFHWFVEFYGILNRGGFDVIIGNPPYVEYSKVRGEYTLQAFDSLDSGNLYAYIIERCIELQRAKARIGMIIQLSAFCTPRMESFQNVFFKKSAEAQISFFDDRPGKLFDGLQHIRVAITLGTIGETTQKNLYTTRYIKFPTEARPSLFETIAMTKNTQPRHSGSVLKISEHIENSIAHKMWQRNARLSTYLQELENSNFVYYGYGFGYWGKVLNFKSYFKGDKVTSSTGDKYIYCRKDIDRDVVVAVMNSSLFYWFYVNFSDGHNFTKHVIGSFPFDYPQNNIVPQLKSECERLMIDLRQNAHRRKAYYKSTGDVEYDEFYPRLSKPIIDQIDRVLAQHYGFTDEELDFIINYDIKYRMGRDGGEENEE